MVRIRLRRIGRKHEPHYRIIAADIKAARDGRFIEELGWYNPKAKEKTYNLKVDAIKKWLLNGAQPSDTVRDILIKEGLLEKKELVYANKPKALKNPDKRRKHRKAKEAVESTQAAVASPSESVTIEDSTSAEVVKSAEENS